MSSAPSPTPHLLPDAPVEVVDATTLFRGPSPRRRFGASIVRLSSGRLLLSFGLGTMHESRNDGVVMIAHSDDDGRSWDEPFPVYAYPGWSSFGFSGLCYVRDDLVKLNLGRIQIDLSLPGPEPMTGWWTAETISRDGGESWSELGPEIRLFPYWTEMYGTSNPFPLSDGRLLWVVIGTTGRDEGWRTGVTWSDPNGEGYSEPVVIATAPDRAFSDTDLVRLPDGRFLAVMREMVSKDAFWSTSDDEGLTWTPYRPTGFKGANIKLQRLRSGLVLCAYRDEDPARRGVSVSTTADGERWRFAGQLYVAPAGAVHRPAYLCGYPDMAPIGDGELAAVLHTYPDAVGQDLQFLRLRDRT